MAIVRGCTWFVPSGSDARILIAAIRGKASVFGRGGSKRVAQLDSRKTRRLNFHRQAQIEGRSRDFVFLKLIAAVRQIHDVQRRIERADWKMEFAAEANIRVDDAFRAISAERIK